MTVQNSVRGSSAMGMVISVLILIIAEVVTIGVINLVFESPLAPSAVALMLALCLAEFAAWCLALAAFVKSRTGRGLTGASISILAAVIVGYVVAIIAVTFFLIGFSGEISQDQARGPHAAAMLLITGVAGMAALALMGSDLYSSLEYEKVSDRKHETRAMAFAVGPLRRRIDDLTGIFPEQSGRIEKTARNIDRISESLKYVNVSDDVEKSGEIEEKIGQCDEILARLCESTDSGEQVPAVLNDADNLLEEISGALKKRETRIRR